MAHEPLLILAGLLAVMIVPHVGGSVWTFRVGYNPQKEVISFKTFKFQKIIKDSAAALTACGKMCVLGNSDCLSIAFSVVTGECKILNKTGFNDKQGMIAVSKIKDATLNNSKEITATQPVKTSSSASTAVKVITSLGPDPSTTSVVFKSSSIFTATSAVGSSRTDSSFSGSLSEKYISELLTTEVNGGQNKDQHFTKQSESIATNSVVDDLTMPLQSRLSTSTDLFKSTKIISDTSPAASGQSYSTAVDVEIDISARDEVQKTSVVHWQSSAYSMQAMTSPTAMLSAAETSSSATRSSPAEMLWSTATLIPTATLPRSATFTEETYSTATTKSQPVTSSPTATFSTEAIWSPAATSSPAPSILPATILSTMTRAFVATVFPLTATSSPPLASSLAATSSPAATSLLIVTSSVTGDSSSKATSSTVATAINAIGSSALYSSLSQDPTSTQAYCGTTIRADDLCCNGVVGKKVGADSACCGTTVYDRNKNGCCVTTLYDKNKDSCCNGVIKNQNTC